MKAFTFKEVGYTKADCCAECKFLAPTVWGEGVDSSWCTKYEFSVWITGICASYERTDAHEK